MCFFGKQVILTEALYSFKVCLDGIVHKNVKISFSYQFNIEL